MAVLVFVMISTFILGLLAQESDSKNGIFIDDTGRIYHSPQAKRLYIIIALIFICVAGLRYYVGTDYSAYYNGFAAAADNFWNALKNLDEPGYPMIAKIAQWIYPDGAMVLFLCSLLTIGLALIVLYRNTDQLFLSLMLFVFLSCWNGSFNGVRQYLAASVLFCGYPYLKEGKFWKYLICVFLAFLCHRSAIVMIAPYFLVRRKVNLLNVLTLIIMSIIISYSADWLFNVANLVMDKEYSRTSIYVSHAINFIRVLVAVTPPLVLVPAWSGKSDAEHDFYLNILIIHACVSIITMSSALLNRIIIYSSLFEMMAIPKLLDCFSERNRRLIRIAIVALFSVYWLYEVRGTQFHWIWSR